MKKLFLIFVLTLVPSLARAQNFRAIGGDGLISTHFNGGEGAVIDTAISTSTSTSFTSPATVNQVTIVNKTYKGNYVGNLQLGTGALLDGDANLSAHFAASGSYILGGFHTGATTDAVFVGSFTSRITWMYVQNSGVHILFGVGKGKINGGQTHRYFVTLTTTHDTFGSNGHIPIASVSVVQVAGD